LLRSDGLPCLLPGLPLRFFCLPDHHLAALTLHSSKASFQLGWIRSSQLPPEFALDRGRDHVRFQAFPESCVSSLTCTSAPNLLRVPHARQAAHAFPVFDSSLRCCPCRYDSLACLNFASSRRAEDESSDVLRIFTPAACAAGDFPISFEPFIFLRGRKCSFPTPFTRA